MPNCRTEQAERRGQVLERKCDKTRLHTAPNGVAENDDDRAADHGGSC